MNLFLFTVDPELAGRAVAAGMAGFVVDWEHREKWERQKAADTEINEHTPADLARLRPVEGAHILCRINPFGPGMRDEIEAAVEGGADELLLPMVRRPVEVETALHVLNGRRPLGIMVETIDAVSGAPELGRLPLSRVFIGLNDLAIERNTRSIFSALGDGTIDRIRPSFPMEFGFGGATLPDRGQPIPARLLMGEIARLECSYTFARRSFLADTGGRDLGRHMAAIQQAFEQVRARTPDEVVRDRKAFLTAVRQAA